MQFTDNSGHYFSQTISSTSDHVDVGCTTHPLKATEYTTALAVLVFAVHLQV